VEIPHVKTTTARIEGTEKKEKGGVDK